MSTEDSSEEVYLKLELGHITYNETNFNEGGLDSRVTSHRGFLDKDRVRVVCIPSKDPDNEVDLSVTNFRLFVASLNRIQNVSKCIGVWPSKKEDVPDGGHVHCFVFEESSSMTLDEESSSMTLDEESSSESSSMTQDEEPKKYKPTTLDVLLHKHSPTIEQLKKLMSDILIVVGQITDMGFYIPILKLVDILIVEIPDETDDNKYHPKLTGIETWKFSGDKKKLLDRDGSYDGKSINKSQSISYERTKIEMGDIFTKVIKKLNHNEEATLLYKNMMFGSLASVATSVTTRKISKLKNHPYFWGDCKCLDFIEDVNQWLADKKSAWRDINKEVSSMLYDERGWHVKLTDGVLDIVRDGYLRGGMDSEKFPETTKKVGYLIRALRHYYVHLRESSTKNPDNPHYVSQSALYAFFSKKFPYLIVFVYKFVATYKYPDAYVIKKYNI